MKLIPKLEVLGAGVLTLAGGGLGLLTLGSATASPKPAAAHVTGAVLTSAPAQVGTPAPATPTQSTPAPEPTTAGDADNVQSGDQTTTDAGAPDTEAPSAETNAAEAPGDTHADAPGQNADHACPPACDTAGGEKP